MTSYAQRPPWGPICDFWSRLKLLISVTSMADWQGVLSSAGVTHYIMSGYSSYNESGVLDSPLKWLASPRSVLQVTEMLFNFYIFHPALGLRRTLQMIRGTEMIQILNGFLLMLRIDIFILASPVMKQILLSKCDYGTSIPSNLLVRMMNQ
jgi:hypothetical protein